VSTSSCSRSCQSRHTTFSRAGSCKEVNTPLPIRWVLIHSYVASSVFLCRICHDLIYESCIERKSTEAFLTGVCHLNKSEDRLIDGVLQMKNGGEAAIESPGIAAARPQHLGERVFDRHVEGIVAEPSYSVSKPLLLANFNVRLFSVTVRTTLSDAPVGKHSASTTSRSDRVTLTERRSGQDVAFTRRAAAGS
jgi:hypothetical protein